MNIECQRDSDVKSLMVGLSTLQRILMLSHHVEISGAFASVCAPPSVSCPLCPNLELRLSPAILLVEAALKKLNVVIII